MPCRLALPLTGANHDDRCSYSQANGVAGRSLPDVRENRQHVDGPRHERRTAGGAEWWGGPAERGEGPAGRRPSTTSRRALGLRAATPRRTSTPCAHGAVSTPDPSLSEFCLRAGPLDGENGPAAGPARGLPRRPRARVTTPDSLKCADDAISSGDKRPIAGITHPSSAPSEVPRAGSCCPADPTASASAPVDRGKHGHQPRCPLASKLVTRRGSGVE